MTYGRARKGEVVNWNEPVWDPLLDVAPEVVTEFMWMHEVKLRDGTRIQAYKHCDSRRYLHLSSDQQAWVYEEPDRYRRSHLYSAVIWTLRPWWHHDDGATEAERDYRRALDMLYMERLGEWDE